MIKPKLPEDRQQRPVILPKGNTNSLQFVKIQTPDLIKKAVEQIRIAEATNISKSKIKEVEEEWQNNLLNWKSKRRQQFSHVVDHDQDSQFESGDVSGGRKIKTFAEMIEERAKSGRNRLGFNLQRYIGDQDEEEGSPLSSSLDQREEFSDDPEKFKDKVDSNYEAQSSTLFSHDRSDLKGSIEDIPLDTVKIVDDYEPPKISGSQSLTCDSIQSSLKLKDEVDNNNQHSFSLTSHSGLGQLNSTLKQDIRPPPNIPDHGEETLSFKRSELSLSDESLQEGSTFKNKSSLLVNGDITMNQELDDDEEEEEEQEEEDEEQEEQRQLQRIAFEAKLKAFEKLTKPPVNEIPKLTPKRIVKTPVAQSVLSRLEPISSPQEKQQPSLPPKLRNLPPPPPPSLPVSEKLTSIEHMIEESRIIPPPVISAAPRAATKATNPSAISLHNSRTPETSPPKITDNSSNLLPPDVTINKNEILIPRSDSPIQKSSSSFSKFNNNITQHSNNSMQSLPDTTKILPKSRNDLNNQVDTVQKLRNISVPQQPILDSPKNVPSPRKSIPRDDKDRTVLSVSGKKRCSSCKEELGRGAAAFVVESLSLVYHTNCFRCSVCHVNLSNGFRGVDVRVHAEALHCQNCYSKDGLNYSRV